MIRWRVFPSLGTVGVLLLGDILVAPTVRAIAASTASAGAADDPSTNFFAQPTVHRFDIDVPETNAAALRIDPRSDVAATVTVDGAVYRDVAVHLKGGPGSMRPFDGKPALTLNFGKLGEGRSFFGMRKIHLNNSVQDRSYANEFLAEELFRAAGVPAARVSFASVKLNGRNRGLYVLKEGFNKDFLGRYFQRTDGNLYERGPARVRARDVDQPMERNSGDGPNDWSDLQAVAQAAREPDLARRWQRLNELLDLERVLSFMAVEILACHRDGYSLAVNNYRIYHDMDTDRLLFFPHGTDQMFANAALPVTPPMRGIVARGIVQTPEGRRRYRERFGQLFTNAFKLEVLTNRLNELEARLRPTLLEQEPGEAVAFASAIATKRAQLLARADGIARHLNEGQPLTPRFQDGVVHLTHWTPSLEAPTAKYERTNDTAGRSILRISSDRPTPALAAWRTQVLLEAGTYRFEGSGRIAGLMAPSRRGREGACLRVAGDATATSLRLESDRPWQQLECEFNLIGLAEVELFCEFRARSGEVCFDADSLRLVRVR